MFSKPFVLHVLRSFFHRPRTITASNCSVIFCVVIPSRPQLCCSNQVFLHRQHSRVNRDLSHSSCLLWVCCTYYRQFGRFFIVVAREGLCVILPNACPLLVLLQPTAFPLVQPSSFPTPVCAVFVGVCLYGLVYHVFLRFCCNCVVLFCN